MSVAARADVAPASTQPTGWLAWLLLCMVALLTGAFYLHMQNVVQRKIVVDMALVRKPPAGMVLGLDHPGEVTRKYRYLTGWVAQVGDEEPWLQPSVLILAPDGQATEFRANLRPRQDAHLRTLSERQRSMAGFEVRLQKRYFPRGQPLKIVLAVTLRGQRILLDTGEVVARPS
jgi:hypothetical protein